ncbi:SMAD/FHA domain-containing protein [Xylaria intraflava]|nr:SMAD/FHA domain-containing protein [Xylaria intraflava]
MTRLRSATLGSVNEMSPAESLPSIRLSAFYDARSNRPSLSFTPVARTLPTGKETIKVGRYSERENNAPVPMNTPSAAPVGFKSKVVSRRHCEFWFEKGKWFVKDVKSSSGTFLNHIRLSAPGTESKPYPVNDGDIVQLGIDFKGGEEMIYRCVKMRVELNRGWQAKPNTFNMATHKRLRDLTSTAASASASSGSAHAQDCSICLNAIAPCQSLFVAPCSHTWHYKCIREMLHGPSWPIFMCPNCRATADLDAEVDEPSEEWQQLPEEVPEEVLEERIEEEAAQESNAYGTSNSQLNGGSHARYAGQEDPNDLTMQLDVPAGSRMPAIPPLHTSSEPVPIPNGSQRKTPSPTSNGLLNAQEGPITPRNNAGPWVFDGNPARVSHESARRNGMGSLNAAAQAGTNPI